VHFPNDPSPILQGFIFTLSVRTRFDTGVDGVQRLFQRDLIIPSGAKSTEIHTRVRTLKYECTSTRGSRRRSPSLANVRSHKPSIELLKVRPGWAVQPAVGHTGLLDWITMEWRKKRRQSEEEIRRGSLLQTAKNRGRTRRGGGVDRTK